MNAPTILILDTASSICSVALSMPNGIFMRYKEAPKQHGKWILSLCEEILKEAKLSVSDFSQFSAIAFTKGAGGSYTGIRMGASVAQAIAVANRLPLMALLISKDMRLENYADFQKNILIPLALEYWHNNKTFSPDKLTLEYADDKFPSEIGDA